MSWGYIAVGVGTLAAGVINGQKKSPKTAPLQQIDPQAQQSAALQGNINNEDQTEQLITRGNKYTQGQANDLMEQALPGYSKIASKFMNLASTTLDDPYKLPKGVEDNISRISAERGISTGIRGESGNFSALRDLGLNSEQFGQAQIAQSQGILQTLASTAPRVNPMSPMALWVTPQQQTQVATQNAYGQQGVSQSANNSDAAARNANLSSWASTVSSLSSIYGGALNADANANKTPAPSTAPAADPNLGPTSATTSGSWDWVPGQGYQWKKS